MCADLTPVAWCRYIAALGAEYRDSCYARNGGCAHVVGVDGMPVTLGWWSKDMQDLTLTNLRSGVVGKQLSQRHDRTPIANKIPRSKEGNAQGSYIRAWLRVLGTHLKGGERIESGTDGFQIALDKLPEEVRPVITEAIDCANAAGRRAYGNLILKLGAESSVTQIVPDENDLRKKLLQLTAGQAAEPHVAFVARACVDPLPEVTRLLELGCCTEATVHALHYLVRRAEVVDAVHSAGHGQPDPIQAAAEAELLQQYRHDPVEHLGASMMHANGKPFRIPRDYPQDKSKGSRDHDEPLPDDVACHKPQFTQQMRSKRKQMLIIVWCLTHREPIGEHWP